MKTVTKSHVMAGFVALTASTILGIENTSLAESQQDIVPIAKGGDVADQDVRNSILVDDNWARHQVVPNRVFVKFRP